MNPSDRVTHRDVNLSSELGTIVRVGRTARGGDCVARWDYSGIESEEVQGNLRPAEKGGNVWKDTTTH